MAQETHTQTQRRTDSRLPSRQTQPGSNRLLFKQQQDGAKDPSTAKGRNHVTPASCSWVAVKGVGCIRTATESAGMSCKKSNCVPHPSPQLAHPTTGLLERGKGGAPADGVPRVCLTHYDQPVLVPLSVWEETNSQHYPAKGTHSSRFNRAADGHHGSLWIRRARASLNSWEGLPYKAAQETLGRLNEYNWREAANPRGRVLLREWQTGQNATVGSQRVRHHLSKTPGGGKAGFQMALPHANRCA